MNPAREEAMFTSALEIPNRLMTDSTTSDKNCKRRLRMDSICDAFETAWLAGHDPHIYDVLSSGHSVRDLEQQ